MRKAEPMRILVAFGALSQVGDEAFEDSGANRSSIARVWHLLAIRGRSMPLFDE